MNKQLLQKHIKTFITKSKKSEFGLDSIMYTNMKLFVLK